MYVCVCLCVRRRRAIFRFRSMGPHRRAVHAEQFCKIRRSQMIYVRAFALRFLSAAKYIDVFKVKCCTHATFHLGKTPSIPSDRFVRGSRTRNPNVRAHLCLHSTHTPPEHYHHRLRNQIIINRTHTHRASTQTRTHTQTQLPYDTCKRVEHYVSLAQASFPYTHSCSAAATKPPVCEHTFYRTYPHTQLHVYHVRISIVYSTSYHHPLKHHCCRGARAVALKAVIICSSETTLLTGSMCRDMCMMRMRTRVRGGNINIYLYFFASSYMYLK